ncbi:hypothetical protein AJ87_37290 [Rhizobium yanglingense]|nr:hypothetical protein AJ87_37290 [Rhizobium yanglingense]
MCLNRIAGPIFMSIAYSNHETGPVIFDPVDNEMGFERMDSNRRRNLFSLTPYSRICGKQVKHRGQLVMIPPRLCGSEHADALLGDRNDVLFGVDREAKMHYLLPRVVSPRAIAAAKSSTGCQHHF